MNIMQHGLSPYCTSSSVMYASHRVTSQDKHGDTILSKSPTHSGTITYLPFLVFAIPKCFDIYRIHKYVSL